MGRGAIHLPTLVSLLLLAAAAKLWNLSYDHPQRFVWMWPAADGPAGGAPGDIVDLGAAYVRYRGLRVDCADGQLAVSGLWRWVQGSSRPPAYWRGEIPIRCEPDLTFVRRGHAVQIELLFAAAAVFPLMTLWLTVLYVRNRVRRKP